MFRCTAQAGRGQRKTPGIFCCHSLLIALIETVSYTGHEAHFRLAEQQALRNHLSLTSNAGFIGTYRYAQLLIWMLGIQVQVSMLTQYVLTCLAMSPDPQV